ncbi:DNA-binding NarL/FixJ family response regulator [Gillisia sp. Hel_I_86]|uniref:response regulator n=1 Tax=Gillisia sp. Hel_I_86 TaxID=1249981 RepID=UPI001199CF90|nr:response regulator [Gillisia sp. Hel_I_86]TVZ27868.1 DNA-binding NarL/FixJ family response regulator [Gillisia sp. Hel_I_86]
MEKKLYTVLLIDDHPLITNSYKSAFHYIKKNNDTLSFNIDEANNCEDAYKKIMNFSSSNKNLDIVFLDISLPPSKDRSILSGEDLGLKINKLMPTTKIIVSTTFNDNYRVHSLFKNLNPDGFLVKNDINPKELVRAIKTVIMDPPYYSKTIIKLLRNEVSSDLILDAIDRKLLHELSIGTMMKDLPEILLLSLPAIEKRKSRMKQVFDVVSPYDKELLQKAKEKGFI